MINNMTEHVLKSILIIRFITYITIYACALFVIGLLLKYPEYAQRFTAADIVVIILILILPTLPNFKEFKTNISDQCVLKGIVIAKHIKFLCTVNMILVGIAFALTVTMLIPSYIGATYIYTHQCDIILGSFITCISSGSTLWFHRNMTK